MTDIKLNTRTSHPLLYSDRPTERFFEISIDTARSKSGVVPPPLNIALVLDRSGSMRGDKSTRSKQAAEYILAHLTDRDRVAVIVYDHKVDVVAESSYATSEHIRRCRNWLAEIEPRGMTNLFEGWLQGCDRLTDVDDTHFVTRVLLLTDGLANQGITDPSEIARHAGALFERGISTSTFGIGTDFDEDLLSKMADAAGGRFRYIEHAGLIPEAFRQEFGDLASVVAQHATLEVSFPESGSVEILGGVPHESKRGIVSVSIGDLYAGERRPYYFRFRTNHGSIDSEATIETTLKATSIDATRFHQKSPITYRFANAATVEARPVDRELMHLVADVEIAEARMEAIRMNKEGRFDEAADLYRLLTQPYYGFRSTADLKDDRVFGALLEDTMDPVALKMRQAEAYRKVRRREKDH